MILFVSKRTARAHHDKQSENWGDSMAGNGDPQTELYERWAAEVKLFIQDIMHGSRDDSVEKWAGMYDAGSVKGQLRLEHMDTGLFRLGFQGKQGLGPERRNAWNANQAIEALNRLLDGSVVTYEETEHWLVVDYDPRPTQVPHPQYLRVAAAIAVMMESIETTYGETHHLDTPLHETLVYEFDGCKAVVDTRVMRFGNMADFMVEVTPRNANSSLWCAAGLIDALEFCFGDDRVADLGGEGTVAATIYAEPRLN